MQDIQRRLSFWGALLFTVGLFTGLWTAAALTGGVTLKIPHLALATHLNGLFGGLWMLAVAFTFPFLKFDRGQLIKLSVLVGVACWANWGLTFYASWLGENGLSSGGSRANDILGVALKLFVVAPSLVGGVYWMMGFCGKPRIAGSPPLVP